MHCILLGKPTLTIKNLGAQAPSLDPPGQGPCEILYADFLWVLFPFVTTGALRKGPPFHGSRSRSSRERGIQNASSQMVGREVTQGDNTASFHCATKAGTQKGIGHFFLFRSLFGNHFVTFFDFFGHYFAYPLLPPPFCGGVIFLQGNEWPRSYREINQHPSLPWNFITHGFLDPSAFPDLLTRRLLRILLRRTSFNEPSGNPSKKRVVA